jgi:hypothetical protein
MLWLSAGVLFLLTIHAGRTAGRLKRDGDPAGLRPAYLAAAVCGAIGTICTFIAAIL